MRKFLAVVPLAVLLAFPACVHDGPTEPYAIETESPSFLIASEEEVVAYLPLLEDVEDRLLPVLLDGDVASQAGAHLQSLTSELKARNTAGARQALNSALEVLQDYQSRAGFGADDAADVEGILLNLAIADDLIG
jgi:hypothetical protein